MRSRLTRAAVGELEQAHAWYERQGSGLGGELVEALDHVLEEIGTFPRTCPRVETVATTREVRQRSIGKFAYMVIYEVLPDEIVVIAIAHKHREPNYWVHRKATD